MKKIKIHSEVLKRSLLIEEKYEVVEILKGHIKNKIGGKVEIKFKGEFWDLNTDRDKILDDLHNPIYKVLNQYNGYFKITRMELPLSQYQILQTKMVHDSIDCMRQSLLEFFCFINPGIKVVTIKEVGEFEDILHYKTDVKIVTTYLIFKD